MNELASPLPLQSAASPSRLATVIRNLTPNWFATTMGTGILAVCLGQFPHLPLLGVVGEVLWTVNIVLFILLAVLYAARWVLHFDEAKRVFEHGVSSMFFGAIPMSLATIINGLLIFGPASTIGVAQTLWWVDAGLAAACGVVIPFMMFTRQQHSMEQMTAVWLLPIVAAEVAGASGGLLVPHLAAADQLSVLTTSYVLWALSVPLALGILAVLLLRLVLHKLPPAGMAATTWLAIGPLGTGALGLLLLGEAAPSALAGTDLYTLANAIAGASILGAVVLWGYGLWWLAIAVLVTIKQLRDGAPFNLGWWAYTFPLGVYAAATIRLGSLLPVPAIGMFAGILVAALGAIWLIVAALTVRGVWIGQLFADPALSPR